MVAQCNLAHRHLIGHNVATSPRQDEAEWSMPPRIRSIKQC